MARKLLFSVTKKDLDIEFIRGSGSGGQHRNKVSTGCRITHRESGAVGLATDNKSQIQNKKNAFLRLSNSPKFKMWLARKTKEMLEGKTTDEKVNEMMAPRNLKIEVKNGDGRWVEMEGPLPQV